MDQSLDVCDTAGSKSGGDAKGGKQKGGKGGAGGGGGGGSSQAKRANDLQDFLQQMVKAI